jgi:hypothetical protein
MSQTTYVTLAMLLLAAVSKAPAQTGYSVIPVTNGGTITGTVKWSGPEPRGLDVPVNKDPEILHKDGIKPRECPVGPEEAAAFLKMARSPVMSLARAGRIPAHPATNGSRKRWLFFLSEIESHVRALGVSCGSHPCAL